jgi:hypothetical protein
LSRAISNSVLEVLLAAQTLGVRHGRAAKVLVLAEHVVDANGTTWGEIVGEALGGAQGSSEKASEKSGRLHFDGCSRQDLGMMSSMDIRFGRWQLTKVDDR